MYPSFNNGGTDLEIYWGSRTFVPGPYIKVKDGISFSIENLRDQMVF